MSDTRCAKATAELLEGDDQGKSVTVPLTEAVYSSGVEVGQVIKLIRVPPDRRTSRRSTSSPTSSGVRR